MKNHVIIPYASENYLSFLAALKESILYANLPYSRIDLQLFQEISDDEIEDAIKKAISICHLVGIETKYHFKKIYVFDDHDKTINVDWRMSKKGFNLVIMQFQKLNQKNAIWLWQLANV